MNFHKFWEYPSSYGILVLWGTAGFGYVPSFSTFLVHFAITPAVMLGVMWLAHHEGRSEGFMAGYKKARGDNEPS